MDQLDVERHPDSEPVVDRLGGAGFEVELVVGRERTERRQCGFA